jgi:Ca2+-binding EF-hand superfamily protein
MTRRTLLVALMSTTGLAAGTAVAQKMPANSKDKLAIADGNVKELLLLMDADKNGRISRQEWMSFMEAEFNKLDKDGSGELDPKELMQSRLGTRRDS